MVRIPWRVDWHAARGRRLWPGTPPPASSQPAPPGQGGWGWGSQNRSPALGPGQVGLLSPSFVGGRTCVAAQVAPRGPRTCCEHRAVSPGHGMRNASPAQQGPLNLQALESSHVAQRCTARWRYVADSGVPTPWGKLRHCQVGAGEPSQRPVTAPCRVTGLQSVTGSHGCARTRSGQ